jgi:ribosomal protein L12E/L44/L45/RPP1/RPP2
MSSISSIKKHNGGGKVNASHPVSQADLEHLKQAIGQVQVDQMNVNELTKCLSDVSLCISNTVIKQPTTKVSSSPRKSIKERIAAIEQQPEEEIKEVRAPTQSKFDPFKKLISGTRWNIGQVKSIKICFAGRFYHPTSGKLLTQADMKEILQPEDENNPDLQSTLIIPSRSACTESSIIVVPDGKKSEVNTAATNKYPQHVFEWSELLERLPEQYADAIQARFKSDQSYKTEERKSHKKKK